MTQNYDSRKVISEWKKKPFVQVVYLYKIGTKNGKPQYRSQTKHERR